MSTFTFDTPTWQALPQRGMVWEGVRGESVELLSGRGREGKEAIILFTYITNQLEV